MVFEQIYKKLERELHDKKKEMANVIEISNIAYEARDQAQNEMAALRAQADKEQAAFEAEWRELGKMIEVDRAKPRENPGAKYELDDDAKGRKQKSRASWNVRQEKSATGNEEKVQTYEEAFQKIQQATGITDIDQLVTNFIEASRGALFSFSCARRSPAATFSSYHFKQPPPPPTTKINNAGGGPQLLPVQLRERAAPGAGEAGGADERAAI